MTDYFSEYSSFAAGRGLTSPADTPYETPNYIRSKRSSRTTLGTSSREASTSPPPPLPPDSSNIAEKNREGRYTALDPRRFTPTLHASLVAEILSLRRDLDSKTHLVESLESSLSESKTENDELTEKVAQHVHEIARAKQQVLEIERGTYDAVEDLIKDRDATTAQRDDLRSKLEAAQRTVRRRDDDAERTQRIWDSERETWDNERRQLERRVHVTETRLRMMVNEVSAHQAATEAHHGQSESADEATFKDSGLDMESDAGSNASTSPQQHRRNTSSVSYKRQSSRLSRNIMTPEPQLKPGRSLADELDIDEEDEFGTPEPCVEDATESKEESRRITTSPSRVGDADAKPTRGFSFADAKNFWTRSVESTASEAQPVAATRPVSLEVQPVAASRQESSEAQPVAATRQESSEAGALESAPAPPLHYVDAGCQPSPPSSPKEENVVFDPHNTSQTGGDQSATEREAAPPTITLPVEEGSHVADADLSQPSVKYTTVSTQTDHAEVAPSSSSVSKRNSLSPPSFVPSIAIHPPTSRPSTPRNYVLPPGTKNAATQANLAWNGTDACMQTEEIRVDRRALRLAHHPLPTSLMPSPDMGSAPGPNVFNRVVADGTASIVHRAPSRPGFASPPLPSPSHEVPRTSLTVGMEARNKPLRVIPLPRPVLAPAATPDAPSEGPLNRSSQYGVTKPGPIASQLPEDSGESEKDEGIRDVEPKVLAGLPIPSGRPPAQHGRFNHSELPKAVPEDKEISPERELGTTSTCAASQDGRKADGPRRAKPALKLNAVKYIRSRTPSVGSVTSTSYSTTSVAPPFPIPMRSSSRHLPSKTHSEGSASPTPLHNDPFGQTRRGIRSQRSQLSRQGSLRKVQSASVMRQPGRRTSPQKGRRNARSPDLTPIQSMAFESPTRAKFPIPDLPTPLLDNKSCNFFQSGGAVKTPSVPVSAGSSARRGSDEASLVDSIAATMVGEWMWKYVRKRKSFGAPQEIPGTPLSEDGSAHAAAHGTRHKRWVWLSPYERTIMWDSKQPTSGTALLGKRGRKLAIQSVMDVPDDGPLPKGADGKSLFNRSILILTPARALKFTTASGERHHVWMTALAFLAQSGRLPAQIPQHPAQIPPIPVDKLPQAPPREPTPTQDTKAKPSFGRANVRDSIRLTKGRRPHLRKGSSHFSDPHTAATHPDDDSGAADFPAVPRLYITTNKHQRKRSNTSPRLPPPLHGLRSLSSSTVPSIASSRPSRSHPTSQAGSATRLHAAGASAQSATGRQSTGTGSLASPDRPNFFEAVGTVRMEAFVDPHVRDGVLYVPGPPPTPDTRPHRYPARRGRGDTSFSQPSMRPRRGEDEEMGEGDPFRNF